MKTLSIFLLLAISFVSEAQTILNKRKRPATSTTVSQPVQKPATTVSGPVQKASQNVQVSKVINAPTVRMKLKLPFTTSEREFNVKKFGHYFVLNGDMIVGNDFPKTMSLAISGDGYKWSNAVIPIV